MRNSQSDYRVVNFNVPAPVLERFDQLCKSAKRTRTSVLQEEIQKFIRATELRQVADEFGPGE